ncbi:nucleoside hydrolase [Cohnella zeiphila]|uniref:Nucleoside hydrolase n=1 Tax=Cohnella zeiphila TaxID=2761120 RepID=A0A7X0SP59_9BACL|nr:nucleoside hydrolase [Cohnella zeiphila]MBB6732315.1 nucleoside hydrolase [Cohnella zeiphila]
MSHSFIPKNKLRVIINTDAKNEADDQYAIVHAILTPTFELHGIIPAHFGDRRSKTSLKDSHDETMLLLDLMGLRDRIRVEDGAATAMPDEETPVDSPGARLIIEEAMKEDDRPLHVAFYGPLTDMASALLLEPRIAERNVKVIWIGGGEWPIGGREYNLSNDIHAANVVFKSSLELWQIPSTVYKLMPVSYAEMLEKVYPQGELGKYLAEQVYEFNESIPNGTFEYRSLGDSPAVGVILYPDCGRWSWKPAPIFDAQMHYIHTGRYRPIRVYDTVDARFVLEDFFAKLARFHRGLHAYSRA